MAGREDTKITIVGLGLMGGSLGLALNRSGFTVTGWDVGSGSVKRGLPDWGDQSNP